MKVALGQMSAGLDKVANLEAIQQLVAEAAAERAELVVLPEAVMHDFGASDTPLGPPAESLDGPFVSALSKLAVAHGVALVAGMFERSEDADRPYNTLLAITPAGDVAATYRKTHLYDSFGYRESDRLLPGKARAVVTSLAGVRCGLLTCYDLRFPEHARALVDAGAEVLVVPAAWVRGPLKEDHWATLVRARAIENTVYVAAAAQCGRNYCGHSMLVDPMGVVVTGMGEAPGVVVGEVAPDRLAEVRERNPALQHRRWRIAST